MSFGQGFKKVAMDPKTIKRMAESGMKKRVKNTGLMDRLNGVRGALLENIAPNSEALEEGYRTHQITKQIMKGPLHPAMRASGNAVMAQSRAALGNHLKTMQAHYPKSKKGLK